jgi:putative lipoprotein
VKRFVPLACALLMAGCGGTAPAAEEGPTPPPASPPAQFDAWQNARERGIDFRAVGQKPDWYLEVDHEKGLRAVWDGGTEQAVSATVIQPTTREGTLIYEAVTGAHQIEVAIEDAPCKDTSSGEALPRTVTVNVDGRALRGCGRTLTP